MDFNSLFKLWVFFVVVCLFVLLLVLFVGFLVKSKIMYFINEGIF